MKKGEEQELYLESFAFEGKSIARVDGMVVFVHGGVPGDRVRARISKMKKQFAEATTIDVLQNSQLRTSPRCRHFGTCGGCKWQHVEYGSQLDFKRQHVADALERIGGFPGIEVMPTIGTDDPFFYRNKMEFSFGDRWLLRDELDDLKLSGREPIPEERFVLGLHIPRRFDKVLDVEECFLQSETSFRIVNEVRAFCLEKQLSVYSTFTHTGYLRNLVIREGKHTGDLMVNLVTLDSRPELMTELTTRLLCQFPAITTVVNNTTARKSQVAIGDEEFVYHGSGFITETIGGRLYRISANSFFQTNTLQAERLYDVARSMARLRPTDVVYDLYSGTGTIALHLADEAASVVGVEAVETAVEDAKRNAEANGVKNCSFILGDLKDRLVNDTAWLGSHQLPDVVVLDPPRAGVHEKVLKQILQMQPRRIVYVSCNPTTQARDLKILAESSHYVVEKVQPVDMFPHTYHIENVVALKQGTD